MAPYPPSASRFRIVTAARTDKGMVRQVNEDSWVANPEAGVWAVADGMGGHDSGAFASRLIVDALAEIEPHSNALSLLSDVRERLQRVHRALISEAKQLGPDRVIGSTVVAQMVFGGHFACLWCGDSRLYLLRNGLLHQITRDHSQYEELVDLGMADSEIGRKHPQANVLTRAVGFDELQLDKERGRLMADDIFLMCSDGLNKMVSDDEIADVLRSADPEEAPRTFIDLALARGASDNVTVLVLHCQPEP